MKHNYISSLILLSFLAVSFVMTSCGGDDTPGDTPDTPSMTIKVRSCSIADGATFAANSLSEITVTYNTTVAVSSADGITLNGEKCAAKSGSTTAMDVVITLPTLEDGKSYTLSIAEGAIVSNTDKTVKAPAYKVSFTTKERAELNIPMMPVTASTPSAKTLYTFFRENYGRRVVSSVMANVNWNNDCAEKVYQLTGKYPAMNCYDFIHILYSPANWIDYTSIKPVQDWVNAGGLVQLMWHFNVPKTEGSTDATCTPSETTFKAANALVSGTWENRWFYEQMDKVVATLLKLQDAGIAATWRPFHEAAGNATAKQQASWTKSWFWWGYDGAETYKKLWVAMFDYFKQKGVNNLIWVWTTQNYNGNSATYNQDTDWYPGDKYVDIVARDLYGYNASQHKQEFEEIQQRYPNKMVALGECGWDGNSSKESATPEEFYQAGALWSHFMVWYQGDNGTSTGTMCSDAWWKAAMSDRNVITRDQLQ